jgi:hypothetical protein
MGDAAQVGELRARGAAASLNASFRLPWQG